MSPSGNFPEASNLISASPFTSPERSASGTLTFASGESTFPSPPKDGRLNPKPNPPFLSFFFFFLSLSFSSSLLLAEDAEPLRFFLPLRSNPTFGPSKLTSTSPSGFAPETSMSPSGNFPEASNLTSASPFTSPERSASGISTFASGESTFPPPPNDGRLKPKPKPPFLSFFFFFLSSSSLELDDAEPLRFFLPSKSNPTLGPFKLISASGFEPDISTSPSGTFPEPSNLTSASPSTSPVTLISGTSIFASLDPDLPLPPK